MGKDLRGKEIGEGIIQQPNGTYFARFVDKFGKRRTKRSKKLQEVKQWLADATYIDQHSNIDQPTDMIVDAWYDYWISIKKQTVRPNTVRKYKDRYERNINFDSLLFNKIGKGFFQKWLKKVIRRLQSIRPELHFTICLNLQEKTIFFSQIPARNL